MSRRYNFVNYFFNFHKRATLLKSASSLLIITACIVFLFGVSLSVYQWLANHTLIKEATTQTTAINNGTIAAVPSTTKPKASAFDMYNVAADLPRYLFIPEIGVQAIVRPLGLLPGGQLKAPTNVYDTGWYNDSSKPGQPGATLIDGHISSWTTHGVFYNLKKLKPGGVILLERGDHSKLTYKVVKTITYNADQVNMAEALSPINPQLSGLNLMSCTGQVIKGTSEFNQRIVVFSEKV